MRRALVAIGSVLVAAALAAGSGANFQSTSANAGNLIKAGVVSISSTKSGSALLDVTALAPDKSVFDTVTITNSGDLAAEFTLSADNLVDTPASPALSNKVDLEVRDVTNSTTVYDGKLGALDSVELGTLAVGGSRQYKFTVSMPDNGLGAEDAYQGGRSTVDFTWSAAAT